VLWLYGAAPLVLLALASFGITQGMMAVAESIVDRALRFADSWPQWSHDLLGGVLLLGVRIVVRVFVGYLALPLSIVLAAPCHVLLVRRVERMLGHGAPAGGRPSLWRSWIVAIRQAVLVTLVVQFGWMLLVPLMLIPGLNVVVVLGAVVLFNGFLVGLLVLAVPLHQHGITSLRAQLSAAWRHRASVIGFGAASLIVLNALPVTPLRAVVASVIFTGAVLLHDRMRRLETAPSGEPSEGPRPTEPAAAPTPAVEASSRSALPPSPDR